MVVNSWNMDNLTFMYDPAMEFTIANAWFRPCFRLDVKQLENDFNAFPFTTFV